ncbi:hypothetical protein V501_00116 [Pseudogymnoascus sp. VKM F-4519 (FW-2642)]|nr:hypothetical protein V501_00116 [Pseudogymnoascus sp. VKM F-4519 (FW-2642)]
MPATTAEAHSLVTTTVSVAPLVLLSVADHYGRSAKGTRKRVVGVLLGQNEGKNVRVSNSFAVPFEEDEKDPSVWFLDHNYVESMNDMFKKVNAKEKLIGWYHSGPKLRASDLEINELFKRYTPNPLLVIIDVQPKEAGVPTDAYFAVDEIKDDGTTTSKTFVHTPSIIEAEEAEEIGVEHLLRDIRDVAVGTLSTRITSQLQSLQGLHLRLRDIQQYLQKVSDGKLPVNHAILGNLQDVFNLLPNLSTPKASTSETPGSGEATSELAHAMSIKTNDQLMAIYISSLIRAITAFHDLIENKIQNRQQQEEKEAKKDEDKEKEGKDAKKAEGVANGEITSVDDSEKAKEDKEKNANPPKKQGQSPKASWVPPAKFTPCRKSHQRTTSGTFTTTTTPIYPPTTLRNTTKPRTIKPPPNPTTLKPSTGHFPHRLPEPRPALDPAHVLAGGDVQPQLQIRKLGQDERARTRFSSGGKKSAMLAAPSNSSPRITSPASATTSAFRYSNSSTTASPSTRNGKSASPALPSLCQQRDMTADTASNGVSGSPATTALGSSNSSQDLVDLKNLNMRRESQDEAGRPDESGNGGGANGEGRTQGDSAGEGSDVRTAIDIQALLQSPSAKRRQDPEPAKDDSSRASQQFLPPKRPRAAQRAPKVLPIRYELVDVEDMVILVAGMVSELIQTNDNLPLRDVVLTRFHSRTPPGISVLDYLQRLAKHAALTPPLLLSMVYYMDRLCSLYPAFTITTLTVHRFLITAATVAAKGLSDSFWNNTTYARVGGIKLAELGLLELEFLHRVDWRIVPNPEVLVDYYRGLVARTGDYVIEDEAADVDAMGEPAVAGSAEMPGEEGGGRDTKWEMWMRDVAHTSDTKGGPSGENSGNVGAASGQP